MKDFHKKLGDDIARSTSNNTFAKIGKVTTVHPGGTYTVELGGGQILTRLNSVSYGSKFYEGQWITLEFFGGDWIISGESAQRGGN